MTTAVWVVCTRVVYEGESKLPSFMYSVGFLFFPAYSRSAVAQ